MIVDPSGEKAAGDLAPSSTTVKDMSFASQSVLLRCVIMSCWPVGEV